MTISKEIVEQINEMYKKTAYFSEDADFRRYKGYTEITI